ncbi:MAG TPA: DUF192 domain-containing protein [Actinomycetota bacterium]
MARARSVSVAAGAVALLGVALLAAQVVADRSGHRSRRATAATGTGAPRATYLLEPSGRPAVGVSVEVAATPAARERGLMGRTSVPAGTGMVFLMPSDTTVRFWMKDTLVPLSIAFVAADGHVVEVDEMPPCHANPCPTYGPNRPYRSAIELAAGGFSRAGIHPGDLVVPEDPTSLPAAA